MENLRGNWKGVIEARNRLSTGDQLPGPLTTLLSEDDQEGRKNRALETINTILDFVEVDLSKVDLLGREDVLRKIARVINDGPIALGWQRILHRGAAIDDDLWRRVVALQEEWLWFLGWFADHLDGVWQIELPVEMTFTWGATGGATRFTFCPSWGFSDKEVTGTICDMAPVIDAAAKGAPEPPLETLKRELPPGAIKFFEALHFLPANSLRRCPLCKRLFCDISAEDWVYCPRHGR